MNAITRVTLVVFAVAWGTNVSTPFLSTYRERLDLGDSATMAIFTVYVIGIMGSLLLAGPLSDRIGRKVVVASTTAASVVASLILIWGRDAYGLLLLGRLLLGVASGAVLSVSAAWLQELYPPDRQRDAALRSTVVSFGGFGIGPPISALFDVADAAPLVAPFVVHAVATAAALALLSAVPETSPKIPRSLRPSLGVPATARRRFGRVVVPAAIWVFAFPSTSFALFPVLISDGIDASPVVVAAIAGAITAWSALLARPLVARIGLSGGVVAGMVSGLCGWAIGATALGQDIWPLVLPAALLLGCASGLLTAGALGLLAEVASPDERGRINSTFYLLAYPGMAMPVLLTTLAQPLGVGRAILVVWIFAATATVAITAALRGDPAHATIRSR